MTHKDDALYVIVTNVIRTTTKTRFTPEAYGNMPLSDAVVLEQSLREEDVIEDVMLTIDYVFDSDEAQNSKKVEIERIVTVVNGNGETVEVETVLNPKEVAKLKFDKDFDEDDGPLGDKSELY